MSSRKPTVPAKRPDRPQFTQAEWRWLTMTFKALPRQQQIAVSHLVEVYADLNAEAARKAVL